MILRIWHGYTAPENADAYEGLLKREIFHGIEGKALPASAVSNCCGANWVTRWSSSR
jgi:hypothetical protein